MGDPEPPAIEYRRARFTALLPTGYLYTQAHFWMARGPEAWRVGLTKFATRMLGEMVDFGFELPPQAEVQIGQKLGWVEGFKAVSDLYSPAQGVFLGGNPALEAEVALINKDPHGAGWLYQVRGTPDPGCLDAAGYAAVLDVIIDGLWSRR